MILLIILGIAYIIFAIYVIDNNLGIITDREKWMRIRGRTIKRDCKYFKSCWFYQHCNLWKKCRLYEKNNYMHVNHMAFFESHGDWYSFYELCMGVKKNRQQEIIKINTDA